MVISSPAASPRVPCVSPGGMSAAIPGVRTVELALPNVCSHDPLIGSDSCSGKCACGGIVVGA